MILTLPLNEKVSLLNFFQTNNDKALGIEWFISFFYFFHYILDLTKKRAVKVYHI